MSNSFVRSLVKPAMACGLAASVLLSGCASTRIADALEGYGIAPGPARCVGQDLSDRLSYSQLSALSRAAKVYRESARDGALLTILDLTRAAAEIRDPAIPIEIVRAAVNCKLLSPSALADRF